MRINKNLYLILIWQFLPIIFLLLISGCSFFTRKVESLATPSASNTRSEKVDKKNTNCTENNKNQLLLEDESTLKYYLPLIPKLFETKNFSFIQKAAMLSLIEMSRRPDEASPSARLQYFMRFNGKDYYFDFHPKNLNDNFSMSYLKGIDFLIKNFDNSKNISQLAEILDRHLPQNTNVSPELEFFLKTHRDDLLKNETLYETFFKGDENLTQYESFKRVNLKKFIQFFNTENTSKDSSYEYLNDSLFKINDTKKNLSISCNVDINEEDAHKKDLFLKNQNQSHYFSIKEGQNFFIAVSSTIIQKPFKNFNSTYFFNSAPSSSPFPICRFNNLVQDIILFSTSGRNPSQHLKHLVSYDIDIIDSLRSLEELLKFSRHLFLSNPDRILYESKKGRKSQLDFFLSMNFPIYHVSNLGDIVGIGIFKNNKYEESLILDDRSKAKLWCSP